MSHPARPRRPLNGLAANARHHHGFSSLPGNEAMQRRDWTLAVSIGLGATFLAAAGSWQVSLWTDESATISASTRSLSELWYLLQHVDAVHGLYYMLLHFWIGAFGQSPFSLRLPSAMAIGGAAIGVYWLGRSWHDRRLGVVGALVFAILPRVSWAGIEARSYALSALAAVWLTVVLVVALRRHNVWTWMGYAVLVAFSVGINLYLLLLVASHGLTLLSLPGIGWRHRWHWLLASAAGSAVATPVLLLSARQSGQIGDESLSVLRWARNVVVNQWFLGGTPTVNFPGSVFESLWKPASVALACVCWLLMLYALLRIVCSDSREGLRYWLSWLLPPILLPTLAIGIYSLLVHPMYNPRYLTFTTPAIALLLGVGLRLIQWRRLQVSVGILVLLLAAPVYISQRQPYAKNGTDWNSVAMFVHEHAEPGDGVYFSPRYPSNSPTVGLTLRRIAIAYPGDFTGLKDLTADVSGADSGTLDGYSKLLAGSMDNANGVKTVWVIRRLDYPVDAARADDALLRAAGYSAKTVWKGPLDIVVGLSR